MRRRHAVLAAFAVSLALAGPAALAAQEPLPPRPGGVLGQPVRPDTASRAPAPATPNAPNAPSAAQADTARRAAQRAAAATDSIVQRLLRLEGFVPVEYQGDTADFSSDTRTLRLIGKAQVERQGDRLTADTIVYHQEQRRVEAFGAPTVAGQAQDIQGEMLVYDFDRRRATIRGGRTTVAQGATWLVQGDVTAERSDTEDRIYTRDGCFTTDDRLGVCTRDAEQLPQYHFQADRIMVVRNKLLVARPARLYFQNVPVFWLPFIVQNLERGRRSGLLVPQFGINDIVQTSGNQQRSIDRVGMYWAINEYMDGQLYGGWLSGEYTKLTGNFRYNVRRQFLNGHFGYSQFWREQGNQFMLNTGNSWRPTERTTLGLNAQFSTSSAFVRRVETNPNVVTQELTSNFNLAHRFDWGSMNFSADRRQGISDGNVRMTLPGFSVNTQPISFGRSASFSFGGFNATRTTQSFGETIRPQANTEQLNLALTGISLQLGNFSWNSGASLVRNTNQEFFDTANVLIPGLQGERGSWNSSFSYRIPLVGTTSISPNVSLNQQFARNDTTASQYVTAPARMNFGAGVNTDLYGLFPGVGPYSDIRHKFSPSVSYAYSPEVQQTPRQDSIFGRFSGRPQNVVTLSFNQTFEAKLRTPRAEPTDTVAEDGPNPSRPRPHDPAKITLLRLQTSPIQYDFQRASEGFPGLMTRQINNTIGSDYLAGITVTMTHDLFDSRDVEDRERDLGRFAPRLTQFNTGFTLGPDSWLFRFLGLGRTVTADPRQQPGRSSTMPDDLAGGLDDGFRTTQAGGGSLGGGFPSTGNPQFTGRGTWNLGLDYAFTRSRPRTALDDPQASQTLNARLTAPLTPNWGMNWMTSYSITDRDFGMHQLSLIRDLHRWQASFNFNRTPAGVTSFFFQVRLIDLPDLKFDYRERNIGGR
jgi:hypothetical protein